MSVLIDTPIWSALLRRQTAGSAEANKLRQLISTKQAIILGPIRQELLSGIRDRIYFERVRDQLRAFPDWIVEATHFELAAEFNNLCRTRGIQGSPTDFLICAVAEINKLVIFTTDRDFEHFATVLPIRLLAM